MARSIWTGSISFGLVNVPVRVFPAIREHDVRFHQLAPDGSRIQYKRVSEKTGREIDYDKIKRGYEIGKGKWVTFEHDELNQYAPKSTKTIEVEDFVSLDDIDPVYFERTYHLAPADVAASHAYALLASVMNERQLVGVGKVVMRDKQYLAAIRPYGKGLAMSTMRFADEVVDQADVEGLPSRRPNVSAREKELAGRIVDSLEREWDPRRYHDDYEEQLRAVIEAKAKGKPVEQPEEEARPQVRDLMEALQASLDRGTRSTGRARRTKKVAAKKSRETKKRAPSKRRRAA
jgi:DNA end-binding protein Ku